MVHPLQSVDVQSEGPLLALESQAGLRFGGRGTFLFASAIRGDNGFQEILKEFRKL